MKVIFLLLVVALVIIPVAVNGCGGGSRRRSSGPSLSSIRAKIARVANSKVGSTHWSYTSSCCHGSNTNKCNYFVYDVGRQAGAKMPTRSFWRGPVGAGDGGWGKATSLSHWSRVSSPQDGDIVAGHRNNVYHVGIYAGHRMVVSANRYNIGKNSNMFTKGYQDLVYWRYQG